MAGAERTGDYAGDVAPADAWTMMKDGAVLVDVRTRPEWTFVGTVAPEAGMADPVGLEWQVFPAMQVDADFATKLSQQVEARGGSKETPLVFLCRSGVRSLAAAKAMSGAGHPNSYNIAGGFEGDPDGEGHRGRVNGWKAAGLPWRQG